MDTTVPTPPLLRVGRTVGDYVLLSELGRGGFGVVFEAKDGRDGSKVALKTLRADLSSAQGQRALTRFLMEVRAVRQIKHPNVVRLIDAGRVDGEDGSVLAYYAMELLHGETLEQKVRNHGPMNPLDAASVIRQAAVGLYTAHVQGIIHRDVKPGNIFLCHTGRVVVTDFGVCKIQELNNVTAAGQVVGTARYLSPEQFAGVGIDARSDVFGLGALLYYLLMGEHLRIAKDLVTLNRLVPHGEDCKRARESTILPQFKKVLCTALAVEPAERYQSALELAQALQDVSLRPDVIQRCTQAPTKPGPTPPPQSDPDRTSPELEVKRPLFVRRTPVPRSVEPTTWRQRAGARLWDSVVQWPPAAVVGLVAVATVVILQWAFPGPAGGSLESRPRPAVSAPPAAEPARPLLRAVRGRVSFWQRFEDMPGMRLLPRPDMPVASLQLCAYRAAEDAAETAAPGPDMDVRLGCARTGPDGSFEIPLSPPVVAYSLATFFCDGDTRGEGPPANYCLVSGRTGPTGRPLPASFWTGRLASSDAGELRLVNPPLGGGTNVASLEDAAHLFRAAGLARQLLGELRPDAHTAVNPCAHPGCQGTLELVLCPLPITAQRDPRCDGDAHAAGTWSSVAVHAPRSGLEVMHALSHALLRRWRSVVMEPKRPPQEECYRQPWTQPCPDAEAQALEGFTGALAAALWLEVNRPGEAINVGDAVLKKLDSVRPAGVGGQATLAESMSYFLALHDESEDVPAGDTPACTKALALPELLKVWSHPSLAGRGSPPQDLSARRYSAVLEQSLGPDVCWRALLERYHL